jgi:hypothetical protein
MAYISNKLTHWLGRQASTPDEQYMLLTEKILAKKELLFSRSPIRFFQRGHGIAPMTFPLPMICFTDAPFSEVEGLCDRYSRFGVVFDKAYLANCLTAPVGYALHPYLYEGYPELYHTISGLRQYIEGISIPSGNRAGKVVSVGRLLGLLTRMIAYWQNYDEKEFEFNVVRTPEGYDTPQTDEPLPTQTAYFEDPHALYFEREWRMVLWPDMIPAPWHVTHDGNTYFRFNEQYVPYVVLPREFKKRLIDSQGDVFKGFDRSCIPAILSFEDLRYM